MRLTHICLRCRTLLGASEPCDACESLAEVVALRSEEGRAALRRATSVDTSPEAAKASARWEKAFGPFSLLVLVAIIAGSIWAVKAELTGLFFAIVLGGPVLWVVGLLFGASGWSRRPRPPYPAATTPEAPPGPERRKGTVAAGAEQGPPLAEALTLDLGEGRGVMLRAGWTEHGFEVELDEGGRLRVPAGRLRLADPAASFAARMPQRWARWFEGEDLPAELIFPHERAQATVLAGGERVEVVASVETEHVEGVGYREEATDRLVARGTPWVLVLEGEGRRAPTEEDDAEQRGGHKGVESRSGSVYIAVLVTFIVLFVVSGMFGYALTWLPSLTESSWKGWALARVLLTLGSAVGVAGTIAFPMLPSDTPRAGKDAPSPAAGRRILDFLKTFLLVAVFAVPIGALFCRAPLTDLIRGPVEAEVTSVRVDSRRGTAHRTVSYTLEVDLASGETLRSGGCLSAPHAPTWQRMAEPCQGSGAPMHVRFLRAMMAPLEVECLDGRPRPAR